MLLYPGRSRERIVVFGTEGVGKSLTILDVAGMYAADDGVTVWVIDNDNAWDRMLEGTTLYETEVKVREEWRWNADKKNAAGGKGAYERDGEYEDEAGVIVLFHADGGWLSNVAALDQVKGRAGRDDWCGIDSGSALWDDVQAWFTQSVFDSSMSDYFMQVRMQKAAAEKDAKALGAFDGWVDWPVINATYKDQVMSFLVKPPCHLIVTAEQAEVTKEDTDKETRALYGSEVKPRGQKRLGHNVQTVIRMRREASGGHVVWTLKDRGGREKLTRRDVTDESFVDWYLVGVAGWTVDDADGTRGANGDEDGEVAVPAAPVAKKKSAALAKG